MTRKTIYLITVLIMLLLSMSIGTITAQEGTDEPPTPTAESSDVTVIETNPGDVVVFNPPEQEAPQDVSVDTNTGDNVETGLTIGVVMGLVLGILSALKPLMNYFLNPKQRGELIVGAEAVRDVASTIFLTLEEAVVLLGAKPNVSTSLDPPEIAKALHNKALNVYIDKDVDFSAVLAEYQKLENGG